MRRLARGYDAAGTADRGHAVQPAVARHDVRVAHRADGVFSRRTTAADGQPPRRRSAARPGAAVGGLDPGRGAVRRCAAAAPQAAVLPGQPNSHARWSRPSRCRSARAACRRSWNSSSTPARRRGVRLLVNEIPYTGPGERRTAVHERRRRRTPAGRPPSAKSPSCSPTSWRTAGSVTWRCRQNTERPAHLDTRLGTTQTGPRHPHRDGASGADAARLQPITVTALMVHRIPRWLCDLIRQPRTMQAPIGRIQ